MKRKLVRLLNEAEHLLGVYEIHKDSQDETIRRKVHMDLDRFLMENREVAALLMVSGLKAELAEYKAPKATTAPWYKKILWPRSLKQ